MGSTGCVEVIGAADNAIGMKGKAGAAIIDHAAGHAFRGVGGAAGKELAARAFGDVEGNAVVDGIHHAANGLAAVAQCAGAAQNLHFDGGQWINRHAVVAANVGGVMAADTVFRHPHARGVKAADHRASGAR